MCNLNHFCGSFRATLCSACQTFVNTWSERKKLKCSQPPLPGKRIDLEKSIIVVPLPSCRSSSSINPITTKQPLSTSITTSVLSVQPKGDYQLKEEEIQKPKKQQEIPYHNPQSQMTFHSSDYYGTTPLLLFRTPTPPKTTTVLSKSSDTVSTSSTSTSANTSFEDDSTSSPSSPTSTSSPSSPTFSSSSSSMMAFIPNLEFNFQLDLLLHCSIIHKESRRRVNKVKWREAFEGSVLCRLPQMEKRFWKKIWARWLRLNSFCHDPAAKFMYTLVGKDRKYLIREDFEPLIQDIVDTFPGLYFLREAVDFHSRYVQTVIARIFYTVNRSWTGRITVVDSLETLEDINMVADFFSYEHFYVIYCKFWEIDRDHDLFIDKSDLARHESGALTPRIIDRIFSGAVRPIGSEPNRMSYSDFVAFLIAEEDKRHPTSIEYWFRCLDLDGDGQLSMYELEYFYEDIARKMESMSVEPMLFNNILCQLLDIVKPERPDVVRLRDIRRCGMAPYFYNTFTNIHKHFEQESESTDRAALRTESGEEMSEWDRYCAEEYEILMQDEQNQQDNFINCDDSDVEIDQQQLSNSAPESSLRSALQKQSPTNPSGNFPLDAL